MLSRIFYSSTSERERIITDFLRSKGLVPRRHWFSTREGKHCNIWATFIGRTPKTIVVSTHYDGSGAYDNACGISALLYMIEAFHSYCPKHNIIYCFFDCEEEGQLGSKAFLQDFPDKGNIVQHLEIDGSGIGNCLVGVSNFTSLPLRIGKEVIVFQSRADFASFISYNIPALHLFSLPIEEAKLFVEEQVFPETLYILHTEKDNLDVVNDRVNREVALCLGRILSDLDDTEQYFESCSLSCFLFKRPSHKGMNNGQNFG